MEFKRNSQQNNNTPGAQFPIMSADYSDDLSQFRSIVNEKYLYLNSTLHTIRRK